LNSFVPAIEPLLPGFLKEWLTTTLENSKQWGT